MLTNFIKAYWRWCETADRELYALACSAQAFVCGAVVASMIWMALT